MAQPPVSTRQGFPDHCHTEPNSTAVLLDRVRDGDRDALDVLFARHAPALRRWAAGRLPGWAREVTDTDDLVQTALLHTLRRLAAIDADQAGALSAYLRQAVLNHIRDELRRRARRPTRQALDERTAAGDQSPLERAIGRETLDCYERALARLGPDDREAIIGRLELGQSYAELGAALGRTPEASRKLVRRALVRLATGMERPSSG
jgi:RNA polymerase sigma-70 factor (ECF subfamily)